jgi:hypothetical protein
MDTLRVEVSDSLTYNLLSLEYSTASCYNVYNLFLYLYIGYHLLFINRGLFFL